MPGELRIQILRDGARLPTRSYPDDAGLDLYAPVAVTLRPLERLVLDTGIAIELPRGHVGLLVPRSGHATRGLTLVDAPAVIDPGYRGELRLQLHNADPSETLEVEPGARLAQLLVLTFAALEPVEVGRLADGARGERGLGSTGE